MDPYAKLVLCFDAAHSTWGTDIPGWKLKADSGLEHQFSPRISSNAGELKCQIPNLLKFAMLVADKVIMK